MASGPRITSRELMLKTVAEGSVKRKKEPDPDKEVVLYYFPSDILENLKDPNVVDMLKGKILEIVTKRVVSAPKKNEESKTVVENPVMVRDLPYLVRHEICQMLNVERILGGDFTTLAGVLGMKTQHIKLISDLKDPADAVLMWWETVNSATVQNFRLKLQDMRRDDIVEVLQKDQELAQTRYKTCFDQIGEQIMLLNCASLNGPGDTEEKLLAILFGDILEVLANRGLLKREKIGWNFEVKNSTEFPAPRYSEVSCVAETNNNEESIVTCTGNCFASVAFAVLLSSCQYLLLKWLFSCSCNC